MIILGLDIGTKKTGVAFGDTNAGFVVAKETIRHESDDELVEKLGSIITTLKPGHIAIGLPLLPQGDEGAQSTAVRGVAEKIEKTFKIPLSLIDERYSSASQSLCVDDDAMAACKIVDIALSLQKKSI